jgi:hypothetical protein
MANIQTLMDEISQLQKTEEQLYRSLTQNAENVALGKESNMSDAEIETITTQINSLTATRVNLYNTLAKNYHNEIKLERSVGKSIEQQTKTLKILERELNKSKHNLAKLKDEKYNQLKMIEINTYFGKQYENHIQLIKIIVIVGICMLATLLLSFSDKTKSASKPMFNLITIVGSYFIIRKLIDMYLRKNDNYDEYEWPVAPTTDQELSTANSESTSFVDISGISVPNMCAGTSCCSVGTVWSDASGCIVDPNTQTISR